MENVWVLLQTARELNLIYVFEHWERAARGPVHTMPDKFENATLLLQIRLPSILIRLYPHKKIHENGTF